MLAMLHVQPFRHNHAAHWHRSTQVLYQHLPDHQKLMYRVRYKIQMHTIQWVVIQLDPLCLYQYQAIAMVRQVQ